MVSKRMHKTVIMVIAVFIAVEVLDAKNLRWNIKEQQQYEQARYSAWSTLCFLAAKSTKVLCCAVQVLFCCSTSYLHNDDEDSLDRVIPCTRELDLLSMQGYPDPETPRFYETEFPAVIRNGALCIQLEK